MVNRIGAVLLDGLFPHYCCLCGLRSHRELSLCTVCEGELQPNRNGCSRCALPLTGDAEGPRLCGACLAHPPAFERVLAPWIYTEHMAHIIHRWKYRGEVRLTPLLARLWLREMHDAGRVDLLVPVPLHWRRLWHRGYNQSELLCRELQAMNAGLKTLRRDSRLVRRSRPTAAQSGMGAGDRSRNLRGAFTTREPCASLRVAVVDDVLTTGATAHAMALALRDAGAAAVEVWCLARTPSPGL